MLNATMSPRFVLKCRLEYTYARTLLACLLAVW
jgi:hypothetical protein